MDAATQRAATAFVDELVTLIASVLGGSSQRWLTIGTIQPDYSLLTHEDSSVFPPGQYSYPDLYALNRSAANTDVLSANVTSATGVSTFGTHTHTLDHDHQMPDTMRPLAPGDRVLVGWLTGENDPVIIHRLIPFWAPGQTGN